MDRISSSSHDGDGLPDTRGRPQVVLAVRGNSSGRQKPLDNSRTRNDYASDLIGQITRMNDGRYLEVLADPSPTEFCIGAAGYPEKHSEAPDLWADGERTNQNVDAGAEYIVTQMFFDNRYYFSFVNECRSQGIDVPIIPGLRVLTNPRKITSIPPVFHREIPEALAHEIGSTPVRASCQPIMDPCVVR